MDKIAIIGVGNIGRAIAQGLLRSQKVAYKDLYLVRRRTELLRSITDQYPTVNTASNSEHTLKQVKTVILALEPNHLRSWIPHHREHLNPHHTLISCAAGVSIKELRSLLTRANLPVKEWLQTMPCIARAMPNTAAAINQSITCISLDDTGKNASHLESEVKTIFDSVGSTIVIDDDLMAAATVLGACGMAFSLRFIRAASQGGTEIGFDAETARIIATQTAMGAAALLQQKSQQSLKHQQPQPQPHPEVEIDSVTTPRGCTITGLNEMEHGGFSSSLIKGITASYRKLN